MSEQQSNKDRSKVPVAYRAEPINAQSVKYAIEQYFMSHGTPSGDAADALRATEDLVNMVMSSISSDRLALFTPQTYVPVQAVLGYIATIDNAVNTLFNAVYTMIDKSCSGDDSTKCAETVSKLPTFLRTMPLLANRVSTFRLAMLSASSIIPQNKAAEALFYARWVSAMPYVQEAQSSTQQQIQQAQQQQQEK